MKQNQCPKCRSPNIETTSINDIEFIVCKSCGYDETLYEVTPEQRSSQREKSRYSPYKKGGGMRTQHQ